MTWLRITPGGSNEEMDNSVSTVKKFYTMGSTTVAVRTIIDTENALNNEAQLSRRRRL